MDTLGLVLRVAGSLAAVLGLVWMVRRGLLRGGGGRARAAVGSITVLARQQLTGRASVALVQVGGTGLVLGVTDSAVQVLASRPVDELLLQPAEPVPPARPAPARRSGRRLGPTARRESVVLPVTVLPATTPPVTTPPVVPASEVAPPTGPAAASPAPPARGASEQEDVPALDSVPVPGRTSPPAHAPAAGGEPLYEELRRRAPVELPRQERREVPVVAAAPVPAAARPARHARSGARGGPASRGGALTGSALSPATWAQAADVLRERTGRR